jgi:hypothetical protein
MYAGAVPAKKKNPAVIIIAVLALIGIGVGAFFFFTANSRQILGEWELVGTTPDLFSDLGVVMNVTMTVNSGGNGTMNVSATMWGETFNESVPFTWSISGKTLTTNAEGEVSAATITELNSRTLKYSENTPEYGTVHWEWRKR